MDRTLLGELIEQITAEVLRRLKAAQEQEGSPEQNVVLVNGTVSFPECLLAWLQAECGGHYTLVQLADGSPFAGAVYVTAAAMGEEALTRLLYQSKRVLLACPQVGLLRQIAHGNDSETAARLLIKAILWQKQTAVLLDYEPPKFRRNSFLGSVAEALEALRDSGVGLVNYCAPLQNRQNLLTLVTEENIRVAARTSEKTVLCTQKAIVTPAAADAAKELNVIIQYG